MSDKDDLEYMSDEELLEVLTDDDYRDSNYFRLAVIEAVVRLFKERMGEE